VVISAGPAVNILVAFAIIWVLLLSDGQSTNTPSTRVAGVEQGTPAARVLKAGDQLISVDGVTGSEERLRNQIATHRCAGVQAAGCLAATPVKLVIRRDGKLDTLSVRPRYSATYHRPELGFYFAFATTYPGVGGAASGAVSGMWSVTKQTVSTVARVFEPQDRKKLNGIVGAYTVTQQSFATSASEAFQLLALISLSLGVINLFPFLPLDGGHIFWALAEKIRGRRISFAVMERAGMVGFVLIIMLFFIGLSNDIGTLAGKGFSVH
jgi:regulator of sigma E protease